MGTGEKMKHLVCTHTLKNTLTASPKPLTFLQLNHWNVCSKSCFCLLNYCWGPDGRRSRHVTSDTLLGESLSKLPGWERFSVNVELRQVPQVWVGVSKVALGTSQFDAGCAVILIRGNIWEFAPVETHLSHFPLTSDISATAHGLVTTTQIISCWSGECKHWSM